MRAKDFIKEKEDIEQTQEEGNVMIPPLQQALEIDKAKLDPDRAKRSKPIRQLLDKSKKTRLPNQPN